MMIHIIYSIILIIFSVDALMIYLQSMKCVKSIGTSILLKIFCFVFIASSFNLVMFLSNGWKLYRGEHFLFIHTILLFIYLTFVISNVDNIRTLGGYVLRICKRTFKPKRG